MELEYLPPPENLKGCFVSLKARSVLEKLTAREQLIFDVASEGTLFTEWGENVTGNVLAFFVPNKPVPAFKFAQGKKELIRKFRGEKARFYQGIAQFFKLAKEFKGECVLLSPSISVYLRSEVKGEIVQLKPGAIDALVPMAAFTAVVVVPAANASLLAGGSMMQEQVLRIGISEGWGLAL